jgi:3-hydroxyisobutyryl-CoA hydrolase
LIDATIEEFVTGLPHDQPIHLAGETREAIDRCFSQRSVPEIISALEKEKSDWATKTLATLRQRSPTSVYVALRQMMLGREWSIQETFQREYHIAAAFMAHSDFTEGVTAQLIRKPKEPPVWQPQSLEDITDGNEIVEPFFKVSGQVRLPLLQDIDYTEYPHAWIGLPRELEVEKVIRESGKSPQEVVEWFVEHRGGKQGVREKVQEIVARKTKDSKETELKAEE